MPELKLVLPVPPTINHAYRNAKVGKRFVRVLTDKAKKWVSTAKAIAIIAVQKQKWTMTDNVQIVAEIDTFFPDKRRRDCHNGAKVMLDALEDIVYADDKMVLPRYMDVSVDRNNPRTEIRFYPKECHHEFG